MKARNNHLCIIQGQRLIIHVIFNAGQVAVNTDNEKIATLAGTVLPEVNGKT